MRIADGDNIIIINYSVAIYIFVFNITGFTDQTNEQDYSLYQLHP